MTTRKPHQYWCVYDYEGTVKQFNDTSTRMLRTTNTKARLKRDTHDTLQQTLKRGKPTGLLRPQRPATLPFHFLFPLTTSLSLAATARPPVRGEQSCRDSRPLGSTTPLPCLMDVLAQHVHGHVAAQGHLLPAPNPSRRESFHLVIRPIQPDDVQRIVAHVAFSRATGRHTFVFRPSFAFTLPHWTLGTVHFPFVQTRGMKSISVSSFFRNHVLGDNRALLEDISREKGGADVSIGDGAEGLTTRHHCRLPLNREEKELAVRPVRPWHIPLRGYAVRKHTLSVGSKSGPTGHCRWFAPCSCIYLCPVCLCPFIRFSLSRDHLPLHGSILECLVVWNIAHLLLMFSHTRAGTNTAFSITSWSSLRFLHRS